MDFQMEKKWEKVGLMRRALEMLLLFLPKNIDFEF